MPIHRGGWPHANPPNTQFTLNTESPQARGLVGWWPTIGQRGDSTLHDLSGQNNDATFPGGAANPTLNHGERGEVRYYDGGDHLPIGTNGWTTNQGSVALWVRLTATSGYIFEHYNAGNRIYILSSGGSLSLQVRLGDSDDDTLYDFTLGKWTHVVLAWIGGNWVCYVDGNQVDSGTYANLTSLASTAYLMSYEGSSQYSTGDLGDVRVYNRPLPAGEALHQYQNPWDLCQPVIPWALPIPLAVPPTPPDDKLPDKIRISRTYQIPIHQLQL